MIHFFICSDAKVIFVLTKTVSPLYVNEKRLRVRSAFFIFFQMRVLIQQSGSNNECALFNCFPITYVFAFEKPVALFGPNAALVAADRCMESIG